jgi:hypothetical protein
MLALSVDWRLAVVFILCDVARAFEDVYSEKEDK